MVLAAHYGSPTVMCAVRFGNVLGSRGSLLHVVREQLASGSAVTITHPDVTRFFMTIEEAVGLVLEAALMADGHSTYVLDMGDPVRIVDLVESFARLLNVREVEFEFTGLRPGEKMNEELFGCGENPEPSSHQRISMTRPVLPAAGFRARLQELYDAALHNRPDEVLDHLSRLVPEYRRAARQLLPTLTAPAVYPDDF
jgi:FlaA1/EpsC-like NDP-sugar epimerase